MTTPYHIPALLNEAIEALDIKPDGIYVDATFGGGGHSKAILERLSGKGRLLGFDQDRDAERNAFDDERFTFVLSNFRFLRNFLRFNGIEKIDGLLADLGVSFHHFDQADRGFTFREDCRLDMRMNTSQGDDARQLLNDAPEERLTEIFRVYGEMQNARALARAIVKARQAGPIQTTAQLYETLAPILDPRREKKEMAKAFQAIRIEVNHELDVLQTLLYEALDALRPGGRLAIISYHSLEDRMIKNFMKTGNLEGRKEEDIFGRNLSPFRLVTSKPIVPSEQEIEANPRSRSAKLRVAVRI